MGQTAEGRAAEAGVAAAASVDQGAVGRVGMGAGMAEAMAAAAALATAAVPPVGLMVREKKGAAPVTAEARERVGLGATRAWVAAVPVAVKEAEGVAGPAPARPAVGEAAAAAGREAGAR